jgi:hypothetical protein
MSLIFSWQHLTCTLAGVEPITAAISEADLPWSANDLDGLCGEDLSTTGHDSFRLRVQPSMQVESLVSERNEAAPT